MVLLTLLFSVVLNSSAWVQSFSIIGTVRDVSGRSVENVRYAVIDENFQPIRSGFVLPGGRFTVKGLSSGRYTFRIETTGTPYEEQSQSLDLQALKAIGQAGNEEYPVDFVLKFKKGTASAGAGSPIFAQEIPKPALKEYEHAQKNLKNSKADKAIIELKKAIELFPDFYDAMELLGVEYIKKGQYEAALPVFAHAIEINKRSIKCHYSLGVAYLKINKLNEAVEWLEKAAQLEPNSANTQMMLGLVYGTGGVFDKSEAALKKALKLGGTAAAEAHFYLGGLYNKLERYHEAWQELDTYLREAKNLKDPTQIKAIIEKIKEKDASKIAIASLPTTNFKPQNVVPVGEPAAPANSTESGPVVPENKTLTFAPVPPLAPEFVELLRQSNINGGLMHHKLLDFTYLLKKTKRTLNEHGKSVGTQEQLFEAYPIRGEHVLIKLSTNGIASKYVSDERKRAVKELDGAERKPDQTVSQNSSNSEAEGYLAAGITGIFQGKPSYISIDVSTILKSCEFFSPRTEQVFNRSTIALNFRPRAGMNLAAKHAYIARIVGTIWIDQEDKVITRFEGWPATKGAFDLIQSTAPRSEASLIYQQERQLNGLWFPTLIRLNADGNFDLFDGLNWEVIFEFSKYQRFNTSAEDLKVKSLDKQH